MKQIFTSLSRRCIHLLVAMCLGFFVSDTKAQTTATEEFENETSATSFSESGINFNHTFILANYPGSGYGYNNSDKFLELKRPAAGASNSATISINNTLNPGISYRINSFAAFVAGGNSGLPAINGSITVSGTPVGSSSAVSATIAVNSQSAGGNGMVDGLNFLGTPLSGLYFTSLTFTITDNDLSNPNIGTSYLGLDHINFTAVLPVTNQFSINNASVLEGSSGTKTMTFTISRTSTTAASSVQVQSANVTATAGSDYVAFPLTTVSFPVGGATSQTVNVTINGDLTSESDETFNMNLSSPTGGTIFDGTGVGTIIDDDNITETFEDESVASSPNSTVRNFAEKGFQFLSSGELYVSRGTNVGAGNCGGCTSTALDTRTNGVGTTGNVGSFYTNSAGTSFDLKGIDVYTSNNDGNTGTTSNVSVTFTGSRADGSGTVSYTATITPISGDNFQTVNFAGTPFANVQLLSVSVTLGSGINYVALDNIRYGTVSFSGTQLSINDISVLEGTGGGTTTATFTVTRSSNNSSFSVNVATSDISATAGSDYTATAATLNFINGGPLSQTVSVVILRDASIEGNETFSMTLSGATNGVLYQKPVGICTILDDDLVIETFEDETNSTTTFSQSGIVFSTTGRLRVNYNSLANDGSGSSRGYLTTSNSGGTSTNVGGSVGKIAITTPNTGFKLIQLDAWTGTGTTPTFISGPVTFTGTPYGGGAPIPITKTITPTNNTGTGWQQIISFAGTPLENVVLTELEFVAGGSVTTVEIDNIHYAAVTTESYIEVADAANIAIPNGSAASTTNSTDFGTACAGSTISKTFTIKNTGGVNLSLSGSPLAVIGGTNAGLFSVTAQPANTVIAGGSTTFTVRYAPTAAGTHNATITITTNDADNSPYVINIKGTANPLPAFTTQPTASPASGICTGGTVTLSAAYSGIGTVNSSTTQWFRGATPINLGSTGTGSTAIMQTVTGGSVSFTITNLSPTDVDNYYLRITSSAGCGTATSNAVTFAVAAPTLPVTNSSGSKSVTLYDYRITDAACNTIASVQPSGGATQVSGTVSASVLVDASVQTAPNGSPYAPRHYDIVPATNAATATGTITLYFTQAEFTAYNMHPLHGLNLPVDATDAANYKANIRIFQYHGTGTTPGQYTGPGEEINPADNQIVWNATYNRWEVTFSVNGFSGFYLASAGSAILPLNLLSFTGHTNGGTAWLQWKTEQETNLSHFEIERSTDAVRFEKVGQLSAGSNSYRFSDQPAGTALYYYRLKIVEKDGRIRYSEVVAINLKKSAALVQVLPNPFTDKLLLNIAAVQTVQTEIRLVDLKGRTLLQKTVQLQAGNNVITLPQLGALAKGTYVLQIQNAQTQASVKVVKAD